MYLCGIDSLGELRNTKAWNRPFFVDDLRNQRYEYRDMKMLLGILTLRLYLHLISYPLFSRVRDNLSFIALTTRPFFPFSN